MEKKYEPLSLKNQLCFPIYLCSKEIVRRYAPRLEKLDLTYTQYVVMMYLWEKGESNVKDMGGALLLDSGTLTPLLKKLEAKEYVTRVRSKEDERVLNVATTEKGMALRDEALDVPCCMAQCIGLTESEAETLYKLLYKILMNIERSE